MNGEEEGEEEFGEEESAEEEGEEESEGSAEEEEGEESEEAWDNEEGEEEPPPGKPFWIIGHNPNTIDAVRGYVAGGANAIEPDVNVYDGDESELCISHGEGDANAPTIEDFFDQVHQLAREYPNLALVYLDTKPKAARAAHAARILAAVREHLVGEGDNRIPLQVIFSCASYGDAANYFPALAEAMNAAGGQRDNEGVMIDYERDAARVSETLGSYGLVNHCYGFGNSAPVAPVGIQSTMSNACRYRDSGGDLKLVFAWTFDAEGSQENRIDEGCDGLIVDDDSNLLHGNGLDNILGLIQQGYGGIRAAVRADRPFSR